MWALTLQPQGSSYTAVKEEFLSGTPLPLTDAIIHPKDGAMYFAIGGRKVQSGLYRVTYTGSESTEDEGPKFAQRAEEIRTDVRGKYWRAENDHRTLRRYFEGFHSSKELPKIESGAFSYFVRVGMAGIGDRFPKFRGGGIIAVAVNVDLILRI